MATFTYVGKGIVRQDATEKVTGQRMYTTDLRLPRMVHAKILRSPLAHGLITRLDTTKARAYPGVTAVLTGRDIADTRADTGNRTEATFALSEVLYAGQPIAAVLAEDPSIAEEALDLIDVEYQPLPAVVDPVAAIQPGAPLVRQPLHDVDRSEDRAHGGSAAGGTEAKADGNISQRFIYKRGDIEQGFAQADVIIERTWRAAMSHQGYMEPQACVADCSPAGDFTIWSSTQGPFRQREDIAKVLGVSESRISVEPIEMGGGFGGKVAGFVAVLAAVLAREVRRPVKLVYSRSEDLKAANPSPLAVIQLKTGATRDGRLVALQARVIVDCGAYPGAPVTSACNSVAGFYDIPNYEVEGLEVLTNKVSVGALRAPGQPQGAFAIESQMDMMAGELGIDPVAFRIKNAATAETPAPMLGRPWGPMYYKELLQRLTELEPWKSRLQKGPNQGIGVGGGGRMSNAPRGNALVTINKDGSASVLVGQADITGIHTAFAQIAAEELGFPLEKVQVFSGSTRSAPYAGVSAGSTSLRSAGRAVQLAARDARDQLLKLAAFTLEASAEDLEIVDGAVRVKGSPEKQVGIPVLTMLTTEFGTPYPTIQGNAHTAPGRGVPIFTAVAVKVEVDPATAEVTILDAICVQDVGQAINPSLVEGQIQGGLSQALGLGYSEEMQWDDNGILRNPTLLDYRMPVALDLPPLRAELMNFGAQLDELYGAKGIGEPPIIAGAVALANAVADAVGARVSEIPVTSERILRALGRIS
ncbi:MAG: xanthine dehydrogenase family protein molybdopterin-binding subunit [Chloroflexi bacterium]|nr:xanthine dehydrogenase family protein molybdopterin-binding subunit [Chloroflexota bacterium]